MVHTNPLLGPIVRTAAEEAGVSIRQLSTRTGIPRATLIRRLAGDSDFTVLELLSTAEVLGRSAVEWLQEIERPRAAA